MTIPRLSSRREAFGLELRGSRAATLALAGAKESMPHRRRSLPTTMRPTKSTPARRTCLWLLRIRIPNGLRPPIIGTVHPFKYSFALSHKRIESGGWTRQVTARELPISKDHRGRGNEAHGWRCPRTSLARGSRMGHHAQRQRAHHGGGSKRQEFCQRCGAGRLVAVSRRDTAFHPGPGSGRLPVFAGVRRRKLRRVPYVSDHRLALAYTQGSAREKLRRAAQSVFDKVPKKELFIFQTGLPGDLKAEQAQAAEGTGSIDNRFDFKASTMQPTKVTPGGNVKIIDSKIFPVTPISAAIVTLKPGGLRELHWHPNADEWQYYITGKGRMTLFAAGSDARTMDFEEGDVGYIPISNPHYIENTGDSDLVFLEMFKSPLYEDVSLAEWMAHTPHLLMNQHLEVGMSMLDNVPKQEVVIRPA